jgi:uncharacterized protein YkwD
MRVKNLLGRKTAALAFAAVMALGLAACYPPNTSADGPPDPYANQLFQALNRDRANVGLPPLTYSPRLAETAQNWAIQMAGAGVLYHQDLTSLLYSDRFAGYWTLGENIMVGPGNMSADQVEAAWRNSPPHWANITSGAFNVVGIGFVHGPDGRIWAVQDFGAV